MILWCRWRPWTIRSRQTYVKIYFITDPAIVAELPKVKEWKCIYLTCRNRCRILMMNSPRQCARKGTSQRNKPHLPEWTQNPRTLCLLGSFSVTFSHNENTEIEVTLLKYTDAYAVRNHIVSIRPLIKMYSPDLSTL